MIARPSRTRSVLSPRHALTPWRRSRHFAALLVLLLTAETSVLVAQTWNVHRYTAADGVPQTRIEDLVQGGDGRIWFATGGGVVAFDGVEWIAESVEEGLPTRAQWRIAIDEVGGIWSLGLGKTPVVSTRRDGRWVSLPEFTDWRPIERATAFAVDADGESVFIAATHYGVLCHRDGEWSTLPRPTDGFDDAYALARAGRTLFVGTDRGLHSIDLDDPTALLAPVAGVPAVPIHAIAVRERSIWLLGVRTLFEYDRGTERSTEVCAIPGTYDEEPPIRITIDRSGVIYLGNGPLLWTYDPTEGLREIGRRNGLAGRGTTGLITDREGNVWIATMRGISKVVSRAFSSWTSEHGLFEDEVTAVLCRPDGEVLLGHNGGLTAFPSMRTWAFRSPRGLGRVMDLAEGSGEVVWIAGGAEGLGRLDRDGTLRWLHPEGDFLTPHAVEILSDGTRLLGTQRGLFIQRDEGSFTSVDLGNVEVRGAMIRRIVRARDGTFLFPTVGQGLVRFDADAGTSRVWSHSELEGRNCFTALERPDGTVWVGTRAGLLLCGGDGMLVAPPDPLAIDAAVYSFLEASDGTVWIGTDQGGLIWNGQSLRALGPRDGLIGLEANRDALFEDDDGAIWIGTDQGVSVYRRERDLPPSAAPTLEWLGFSDGRQELEPTPALALRSTDALLVRFRAISFRDEDHVRFRTRLVGFDDEWSTWRPIPLRNLRYSHLPAGAYRLEIQAESAEGERSEILPSPTIDIHGPFWSRPWFVAGVGLVAAFVAWLAGAFAAERKHAAQLEEQVRERTRALELSERAIAAERARLAVTIASTVDAIAATDRYGAVILWNRAAERLTGHSVGDALGRPFAEVLGVCDSESLRTLGREIEEGVASETTLTRRAELGDDEGSDRTWQVSTAPLGDEEHPEEVGAVIVFRDITEQRAAEQEMARTERLEALGTLAGGIAHDFNNYLTVVMGTLTLLERKPAIGASLGDQVRLSVVATERARTLASQLLTFSRGGEPHRRHVALGRLIAETVELVLSGGKVRAIIRTPDDLWPVHVDEDQIASVLHNLLLNARRAMSAGGTVRVSARNLVERTPDDREARFVEVRVADEGAGIAPEDLERIFDPYFSRAEGGTGLGLAVAHSIVKRHEGRIMVESRSGGGSEFRILLPALPESAPRDPQDSDDAPLRVSNSGENRRVLILDDHEAVRETLTLLLESLGCEVTACADGTVAIELYRAACAAGDPYHAAILDLTIPGGLGGHEVARAVLALDPTACLIAASGYTTDPVFGDDLGGFRAFLAKPYDLRTVETSLSDALVRGPAPAEGRVGERAEGGGEKIAGRGDDDEPLFDL